MSDYIISKLGNLTPNYMHVEASKIKIAKYFSKRVKISEVQMSKRQNVSYTCKTHYN